MRRMGGVVALALLAGCAGGGASGTVGKACMAGGRDAANPALCSCVQRVADGSLTAGEQVRAATFFEDPERAQAARQSDDRTDERFWTNYRAFADRAEALCG